MMGTKAQGTPPTKHTHKGHPQGTPTIKQLQGTLAHLQGTPLYIYSYIQSTPTTHTPQNTPTRHTPQNTPTRHTPQKYTPTKHIDRHKAHHIRQTMDHKAAQGRLILPTSCNNYRTPAHSFLSHMYHTVSCNTSRPRMGK